MALGTELLAQHLRACTFEEGENNVCKVFCSFWVLTAKKGIISTRRNERMKSPPN